MAKELPYFQFEPAEYLTKDISFCTLSTQGLFINICSFYWQRKCDLTKNQFLRRFNYEVEFNELIKEGIIDLENDKIIIKFLDNQFVNATKKSNKNSENGSKGGRPKKQIENSEKSENKPKINPNESESKGIRKEEIIKEEIKEINNLPFDFKKSCISYGFQKELVLEWLKVRKNKKLTNTETAFNKFINQVEINGQDKNLILEKCIEKSWGGFESDWFKINITLPNKEDEFARFKKS